MLGYVKLHEIIDIIRMDIDKIPRDIDLIVGIPRSGIIPAYTIALYMNRLVTDLETFLADGKIGHGERKTQGEQQVVPSQARHILLVDDSYATGNSLEKILARIQASGYKGKITTYVGVIVPASVDKVDLYGIAMPLPRVFEWNAMHHGMVEQACFDMDGLLCIDPTPEQNDDGPRYQEFLLNAPVKFTPTGKIPHIVSARLEKYRPETEEWLRRNGVEYGKLHLLDLPSAAERQRLRAYVPHKAGIYRKTNTVLFFESEPHQAEAIAQESGKPVLCTHNMRLYRDPGLNLRSQIQNTKWQIRKLMIYRGIRKLVTSVKRLKTR